jgi:DNA-binding transcriptional regulator YiaG
MNLVDLTSDLGHRIKERRLALELSQEELAHQLGVCLRTVHNWERGTALPTRRYRPRVRAFLTDGNVE